MSLTIAYSTYKAPDMERMTGVPAQTVRNWRRRNLFSDRGHKFDPIAISTILVMRTLSDRGLPLDVGSEAAQSCAENIVDRALTRPEAFAGDLGRIYPPEMPAGEQMRHAARAARTRGRHAGWTPQMGRYFVGWPDGTWATTDSIEDAAPTVNQMKPYRSGRNPAILLFLDDLVAELLEVAAPLVHVIEVKD